jgi:hypothetical protein
MRDALRKVSAKAVRLAKPGGLIAFTDWVEGSAGLSDTEADRFLNIMKFPNPEDIAGYVQLLMGHGCIVMAAEDTRRFPSHIDLYRDMLDKQLMYDALKIIVFNTDLLRAISDGFAFISDLAHSGKVMKARFIARLP